MSTIKFILRTDKAIKSNKPEINSKCPIELLYQVEGQRKKKFLDKEFKLHPINWNSDTQVAVFLKKGEAKKLLPLELQKNVDLIILDETEIETVNNELTKIKLQIGNIEKKFELDKIPYSASMVIEALNNSETDKTKKEEHRDFLFDFMEQYIADHEAIREPGSLTVYKSVKNHLLAYQTITKHKVRFETIDYVFFQKFQTFLINHRKLNNTTIAKALSTLKTFLGYARKHGIKVNEGYKDFTIKKEKLEVIALTETEFAALINLDLSNNKRLDQVRDCFVFSCASGLRISDMHQLRREHIKGDAIELIVKKTKTELLIPLNNITGGILEKYREHHKPLPLISSQKLNEYLKELCKLADIIEPIEIVRFKGAKRETIVKPKYELIHLHTGRKTFCTLSLERGMSAEQVMSISGHSDYASFKRYVNVTNRLKKTVMVKAWGEVKHLKAV